MIRERDAGAGRRHHGLVLEVSIVAALAFLVRALGIWQGPTYDELFHVLGARSWLADGTLSINGGPPYDRATEFTFLIAWLFRLFGESLPLARLPSVLAGSALVVIFYVWLRSRAGRTAAGIAAALTALAPDLIESSQWVRFYAAQHLLLLLGAIGAIEAVSPPRSALRVAGWGLLAALASWLAYRTTDLSLIPIGAFAAVVLLAALGGLATSALRPIHRRLLLGAALAALAAVAAGVLTSEFGRRALDMAQYAASWAEGSRHQYRFYHWYLIELYPTLWTLFPVLALLAVRAEPRVALSCGWIFGVAFVAQSAMAWKGIRYFAYALPFFFAVCGLGLAQLLPSLRGVVRDFVAPSSRAGFGRALRAALEGLVLAGVLAFLLLSNHAFIATAKMLNHARSPERYTLDRAMGPIAWPLVVTRLGDLVGGSEAFVVGRDIHALYHFGRADYMLTRHLLVDRGVESPEFTRSDVGVPIVSTPESLTAIRCRHDSGIVLFESWQATTEVMIPAPTLAFIRTHMERVSLPGDWGFEAFRWRGPASAAGIACPPSVTAFPEAERR
jgi:hypothetical protein